MNIKSLSLLLLVPVIFACGKNTSESINEEKSDSSNFRSDSLGATIDSIFDPFYGENRVLMSNIYKINIDTLKLIIKDYEQNTKFDLWEKNHDEEYKIVIDSLAKKYNTSSEKISKILYTNKYHEIVE